MLLEVNIPTTNKGRDMNETKPPANRNISQSSNLPAHTTNTNGLPNACTASTSQQLNHPTHKTPNKNDSKVQSSQPQTPQYKTVQLISRNNHMVSTSQPNCVVLQHVPGNNHALGFTQLTSPEHSRNPQGQTIYRQKGQTFVSSRQQHSTQGNPNNSNQNGDVSTNTIQQTQIPARYAQIHQLQDGRQVQMIQIPNQYVQLSNAPGQNGQPQQIMTYVHSQQQQFVARNGGQSQNVIIASQAQDGSQTLSVPAQIIQHTVSPQNASFQLTQSSLKNVKPLHTVQQQQLQTQRHEILQISNNGATVVANQPQMQSSSDPSSQQTSQSSPKGKVKPKTTPTKQVKPRTIKSSPQTQQTTNHVGQQTATIQEISLPQIRMQTPKGQEKGGFTMHSRGTANIIQIQPTSVQQQNHEGTPPVQPIQSTQIVQQLPANAVIQTIQQKIVVQKKETVTNVIESNSAQQSQVLSSFKPQSLAVNSEKLSAPSPSTSSVVKAKVLKPAAANNVSPIPNDPFSGTANKLNLDLTGGDPKESYRTLKKHFKFLVYENECYQGQLRDFHQRLLKLERDNNYLMDRLLKYENLSDSEGEDSDSSTKTIEDKIVISKPPKKRPANRTTSTAPSRKKANVAAKPPTVTTSVVQPSKASTVPKLTTAKPVVKAPVLKDSPGSSKVTSIQSSSTSSHPTSTSTLTAFQTNIPLPSVYKPFPSSSTSTNPSTPTIEASFVTPEVPKTPTVLKKPSATPKVIQLKAKVTVAELPKSENLGCNTNVVNSPTTSSTVSASGTDATVAKAFRFPTPPRNPTPQSNATVTYSNLKPNAMIPRPHLPPPNARILSNVPRVRLLSKPPSVKPQQFVQK